MVASFNLTTSPWIPLSGQSLVSLSHVFADKQANALGGDPVLKIALYKLLFAIAQASFTPQDEAERRAMGKEGLRERCLSYLNQHAVLFDLYGKKPFLQMPAICSAREVPYGVIQTEIASGNTIRVGHYQIAKPLTEAEKAQLLVTQMSMSLGGKKTDNSVVLSEHYTGKCNDKGKPSTGKAGPGMGFMGFLHSFVIAENVFDTLWLNLLSHDQIAAQSMFSCGLGTAPWEQMPVGEDCPTAQALKNSLIGRLVPLSRFCLLTESGMHFSEGLAHKTYLEGMSDPTVSVNWHGKKPKVLWARPAVRPWRELTALLSFLGHEGKEAFTNPQLKYGLTHAVNEQIPFAIWAGGLSVTANAGEQYTSGGDDVVESCVWLDSEAVGESWFAQLKQEMMTMSAIAKSLYASVCAYYSDIGALPSGPGFAARATTVFWNRCESLFASLVMACEQTPEAQQARAALRQAMIAHAQVAYSSQSPHATARQMDAWAKNQPNLKKYLNTESA